MKKKIEKSRMQKFEVGFNVFYLASALLMGLILVSGEGAAGFLWGAMALILVVGDSFHLTPRIVEIFHGKDHDLEKRKGRGKLIASISMSLFYGIMFSIGTVLYPENVVGELGIVMLVLLVARIVLCLLPQNGWTKKHPSYMFAIIRNIPFVLQSLLVFLLYINSTYVDGLSMVSFAVLLSLILYIPVVLFVYKVPKIGMLMLPKSVVYLWIIVMGFAL